MISERDMLLIASAVRRLALAACLPGDTHSVRNGVYLRTSASQIATYRRCPRAWYFDKVVRVPRAEREHFKLGTRIHAEIATYLQTGRNVLGDIALPAKDLLPAPGKDIGVETSITLEPAGVKLIGAVDWHHAREESDPLGLPEVGDNKTTSDIAKYGKSPAQLKIDVQAHVYGYWALGLYSGSLWGFGDKRADWRPRGVRFTHVTMQKRGRRWAQKVSVEFTAEELDKHWAEIEDTVRQMAVSAEQPTPDDVTPNTNACGDYGGCDYRGRCSATQEGSFAMGLLDALRTPSEAIEAETKKETPKWTRTQCGATIDAPDGVPCRLPQFETESGDTCRRGHGGARAFELDGAIVRIVGDVTEDPLLAKRRDDALANGAEALTQAGFDKAHAENLTRHQAAIAAGLKPADAPPPERPGPRTPPPSVAAEPPTDQPANVAPPAEKKRRGRPPKNATPPASEPTPAAEPSKEAAPEQVAFFGLDRTKAPAREKAPPEPLILYLGCAPRSLLSGDSYNPARIGEIYAARLAEASAQTAGVKDIRFVTDKGSPLAYGGWRGALAAAVRERPPEGAVCFRLPAGDLAGVVIEALEPLAADIVS